jgi:hypothetical protein
MGGGGVDDKAAHAPRPSSDLLCIPIGFIPPVVPYHWQSTVSYTMESHHSRLVPKKVNLSDEIWIQLKPSSFFPLCRFLVVHINSTRTGELQSPQQSPMSAEGIYATGCLLPCAPKGSFATLLPPPQCHAAFGTFASVDQNPLCRPRTLPLLCDEDV